MRLEQRTPDVVRGVAANGDLGEERRREPVLEERAPCAVQAAGMPRKRVRNEPSARSDRTSVMVQGDSCGVPPWWPWPCAAVVRRRGVVVPVRRVPASCRVRPGRVAARVERRGAVRGRVRVAAERGPRRRRRGPRRESADAAAATAECGSTLCSSWCPAPPRYSPVKVM